MKYDASYYFILERVIIAGKKKNLKILFYLWKSNTHMVTLRNYAIHTL